MFWQPNEPAHGWMACVRMRTNRGPRLAKSATYVLPFCSRRHPRIAKTAEIIGAPGRIRTSDPQIRSLVLYPAELRAHPRSARAKSPVRQGCRGGEAPSLVARAIKRKALVPVLGPGIIRSSIEAERLAKRCSPRQCGERSGSSMRKCAAFVLSTSVSVPPCACTSSAAMTRPRPVPPFLVEP